MEVNGLRDKFERLESVAALLNQASNELNAQVSKIEDALAKLNLGIMAAVRVPELQDEKKTNCYIGYGRATNGVWGIFIDSADKVSRWSFQNSPRHFRIKSVDYLPELLEALVKVADKTTKKLEQITPIAQSMADAVEKTMKEINSEIQPK